MNARVAVLALLAACGLAPFASAQTTVTIEPSRDATLYEDPNGATANGSGPTIFAGNTVFAGLRRAVLAFDVGTAIPAGSTITSARLVLTVVRYSPGSGPNTASVHRLSADWGEGASSDPGPGGAGVEALSGDATWAYRFFQNDLWTTPGGDFVATPSASTQTQQDSSGLVVWDSPALAADVQAWRDTPATNFGWIVRIGESTGGSATKFASRENELPSARPQLIVTYSAGSSCAADFNQDSNVDPDDLSDFITCYFSTPPCPGADFNQDSNVDPDDLSDFITTYFTGC